MQALYIVPTASYPRSSIAPGLSLLGRKATLPRRDVSHRRISHESICYIQLDSVDYNHFVEHISPEHRVNSLEIRKMLE